jgi:hypothetical protein
MANAAQLQVGVMDISSKLDRLGSSTDVEGLIKSSSISGDVLLAQMLLDDYAYKVWPLVNCHA